MGCNSPNCGCGGVSSGVCASTNCDATAARRTPFYAQGNAVQENHCREIIFERYSSSIKSNAPWVIPACGETAEVVIPDITQIPIGSYIWNPTYGYFLVQAFDRVTGTITVENTCIDGNAAPGTEVPTCTSFTVSPPPCPDIIVPTPFVALNFTAPAISACTNITLTTTQGLVEGSTINIVGVGEYLLDAIVSDTVVTICNEGDGAVGGTAVVALDGSGEYQYPVVAVIGNFLDQDVATPSGGTVTSGSPMTETVSLSIVNPSATEVMVVFATAEGWVNGAVTDGNSDPGAITTVLAKQENGGGYTNVVSIMDGYYTASDVDTFYAQNTNWSGTFIVNPASTLALDIRATFSLSLSAGSFVVNDTHLVLTAIGVVG